MIATTSPIGHRPERPPRVDSRLPAPLGLPDVPDPGDVALVEQRVAERARRVVRAQPRQEPLEVELVREHVRARARPVADRTGSAPRSSARAAARRTRPPRGRRRGTRSTPAVATGPHRSARPVHAPHPDHPEMRVQHEVALEAQEQVLAVGVDAARPRARQPVGPAIERMPRLRGQDLVGHPALEHRAACGSPRRRSCRPQASSGTEGQPPRPLLEARAPPAPARAASRSPTRRRPSRARCRLRRPGAHLLDQRHQRRLEPRIVGRPRASAARARPARRTAPARRPASTT